MKLRGLLIAAILLAALAGGLYIAGRKNAGKSENETKPAEKVFSVKAEDIQQITLQPASGQKVTLERAGNNWKIADPAGVPADETAASGIASTLGSLSVEEVIADKPGSLKDYGLDPPQGSVQFRTKAGAVHTLLVGESTPTGSAVYVKAQEQPRVLTVASYVKSDLTKGLSDIRDKSVLKIDTYNASRVWLTNKKGALELVKSEDQWKVASPFTARADQSQVSNMLRQVSDAKLDSVERDVDAKYGLNAPEIVLRVQDSAGTHELKIGAEKSGKRYGRSDAQPAVFTLPSDVAKALDKPAAELRDKEVFAMDTWQAVHFDATTPEAHVVLDKDKKDNQWKAAGAKKPVDQNAVTDALDKLKALRADSFPPAAPDSKYGLDHPVLRLQAAWSEKKQQETVDIGLAGKKAYARRAGEAGVYEVPADKVKEARDAINKLK